MNGESDLIYVLGVAGKGWAWDPLLEGLWTRPHDVETHVCASQE